MCIIEFFAGASKFLLQARVYNTIRSIENEAVEEITSASLPPTRVVPDLTTLPLRKNDAATVAATASSPPSLVVGVALGVISG